MIISGQELILIFFILILNLLVLAFVKNRTTMISIIIVSHLLTILVYCIFIPNYQTLKEIIVTNIIYSTTVLALIYNFNGNYTNQAVATLGDDLAIKMNHGNHLIIRYNLTRPKIMLIAINLLALLVTISLIISGFYLVKTINRSSNFVKKKQNERQILVEKNPLILPNHSVHNNIKKYYLSKNSNNIIFEPREAELEKLKNLYGENESKKLKHNILFRRSTDAIMVIVGIMTALLLTYRHRNN